MWKLLGKTPLTTLIIATALLAATAPPAGALHQESDGITALITFEDSLGDLVLFADEDGSYSVDVSIFRQIDGTWEQVAFWATLRVFEDTGLLEVTDRVSIPFQSSADEATTITFSGDDLTGGTLDVFVTFSALGGNPVPTSHHHVAKNVAIGLGDLDLADSLDHHSTRVFAL